MVCTKHLGFSYSDVMKMPTYERRFFIVTLQNNLMKAEEDRKSKPQTIYTGKGRRVVKTQI
jgi:hypothetical protein